MTDFYALLKQSIIERDLRDAAAREAVYAQARDAIIKQLWAYQPPLAADEIDTRVGAYDTAVERIEADLQDAFANGEIPEKPRSERQRAAPPPPPPPPPPEPEEAMSEEDDAPPIADWHSDPADDDEVVVAEEDEYAGDADEDDARGVPRAAANPDSRAKARMDYDEDAAYAEPETAAAGGGAARWEGSAMAAPARGAGSLNWMGWLGRSDHERIQVLAGAIAGSFLALAVLGAYLFFARGADEGVTLDIGVRREVSDAATATRIAAEDVSVEQAYTLFDGRDPTIFVSTPDNPVRFVSEGGGYVRISSTASSPGVKAHIGPGLAGRLAGREVRVTIIARAAPDNGALNMRFAYQSGLAISHWQTANLGADYEAVAMRWRLPAMQTGEAGDYLVIEPGIPGDGTAVDIQSIKIDVLGG